MPITPHDLSRELLAWFEASSSSTDLKRRRWSEDPVGRVIKSELLHSGNWKNAPRGNPKAGFKAAGWKPRQ